MSAQLRSKDGDQRSSVDRSGSGALETDAVLAALDDPDSRALLEATAEEPLTAGELSDRCDIPRSTTYRKVEQLTEAGLLEEGVRLSATGKHASEFQRTFEDVTVTLSNGEGISIGLSETPHFGESTD